MLFLLRLFIVCLFLSSLLPTITFAQHKKPIQKDSFSRISPEKAGFNADSLKRLRDYLETSGTSSMILAYDGNIFFEWGDIYQKHTIHSIRKAMLNSLYGIYVEKGVIDTSMTLKELNIDDIEPHLTETEKTARIADLLKSRSGIYHNAAAVPESMLAQMPERGSHEPDEAYYYNNWDFNVLGSIFEQRTGESIFTAFHKEIAHPIGMQQYEGTFTSVEDTDSLSSLPSTDGFYQYERTKSDFPAYHMRMSAHDMALYGTLYLKNGKWNGRQIIPADWIEASTKSYSVTNSYMDFGYGMLWNVINKNEERSTRSFYHTGVGIHMLAVYPGSKLVFVHRVGTEGEYDFPNQHLYTIISMIFSSQED